MPSMFLRQWGVATQTSPAPKTTQSKAFRNLLQPQPDEVIPDGQRFLRRSKAKPKLPKARSPQPITTE